MELPSQVILLLSNEEFPAANVLPEVKRLAVDVGTVLDESQLVEVVGSALMFPNDAVGLDALLDLMSDLDWFDHDGGYVVEFTGLDPLEQRDSQLLGRFAALIPYLCDRWRSRGVQFHVVLRCHGATRQVVREALDRANAEIEEASSQPWMVDLNPVDIIDYAL